MRDLEACFAYAGDFEDFFETLDHAYLKKQVRRLFPGGAIPDDYYHVLKNATRHSVWDIRKASRPLRASLYEERRQTTQQQGQSAEL